MLLPWRGRADERGRAPVRVGIVGCGAVARSLLPPALEDARSEDGLMRVVAAHDPDTRRRRVRSRRRSRRHRCARPLRGSPRPLARARHRRVAAPASRRADDRRAASGADVHCEKPLAPTPAEGERMVAAAAERAAAGLTVGMVRRHFPATRTSAASSPAGALGAAPIDRVLRGRARSTGRCDRPTTSARAPAARVCCTTSARTASTC